MVVAGVLGDVSHCACQKCVAFDLGIRGQQVFFVFGFVNICPQVDEA